MTLRIGSLCSGYEGLGMAVAEVLGGELAFVADIDPGACKILAHRFPAVPNLGDISAVRWASWAAIGRPDVLTAGFPCFPAGTLVDAGDDGFRPIETLRVGDLVLTHSNRRRAVTAVMRRDADDVLLVKAMGSPAFRATAEHPFYVRRLLPGRVRTWSAPEWVQAGQLGKDCFLGMPIDAAGEDRILGNALAYVVGRWLGDGWIIDHPRRHRAASRAMKVIICCSAGEADQLAGAIAEAGLHATRAPDRTVVKFHISSAALVKALRPFGRGAAGKRLPGWVFAAPQAEREAILQGWLDADGSQQASGAWRGTTVSEELAHGMARLARSARRVATSVHRFDVAARTVIEGRDVAQRAQFQVVIPPRNRESFIADGFAWVPVRSVTEAEPCEVFNVSVDEDESYTAFGYAVHNCQDVSCAGGRAGLREGNRTGVWAHVARAIDELRPPLVVLENVRGLLSAGADSDVEWCAWCLGEAGNEHPLRASGAVLGDLASLGYDARWQVVSAADAGAPHRRERIFIVAWPAGDSAGGGWRHARLDGSAAPPGRRGSEAPGDARGGYGDAAADAAGERRIGHHDAGAVNAGRDARDGSGPGDRRADADPSGGRRAPRVGAGDGRPAALGSEAVGRADDGGAAQDADRAAGSERRQPAPGQAAPGRARADAGRPGGARAAADARGAGLEVGEVEHHGPERPAAERGGRAPAADADGSGRGPAEPDDAPRESVTDWGAYAAAISRWELATGRPAPRPTEPGRTGERLSPAFVEWMMGLPAGWVTGVPGLSRNAQLKALGNGVVWQQAALALRILLADSLAAAA